MRQYKRDLVVGLTPFGRPDPAVVVGLCRAGALGVLAAGIDGPAARTALDDVGRWADQRFGVRAAS